MIEPPSADGAVVSIDVSADAELTPELRQALEVLAQAIEAEPGGDGSEEVTGFRSGLGICDSNMGCFPRTQAPCFKRMIVTCTIKPCPTYYVPDVK